MLGRSWRTQTLLHGSLRCKRGTTTDLPAWCTCQPRRECKQRPACRCESRNLFIWVCHTVFLCFERVSVMCRKKQFRQRKPIPCILKHAAQIRKTLKCHATHVRKTLKCHATHVQKTLKHLASMPRTRAEKVPSSEAAPGCKSGTPVKTSQCCKDCMQLLLA
jgi:hypothetical protein